MLIEMDEMQTRLDALVAALDGQDPGAIIAASEALATAVILFRGAAIPAGAEARARVLIGQVLRQLEAAARSEEHTSELQSLMRISYAVFCLKKNKQLRSIKLIRTSSVTYIIQH